MADVATNANGTTERNGSVVTTCLPTGVFKTDNNGDLGPTHNTTTSSDEYGIRAYDGNVDQSRDVAGLDVAAIETRWTNRFDDPTYYSA